MADEPRGFIYTMQDVKTLVLFVLARLESPVPMTTLYELCFQDDRLSYFDLAIAVPQLVATGHIAQSGEEYSITELGRTDGAVLEGDLALSLRSRCQEAIERYQAKLRREEYAHCEIVPREDGMMNVVMTQQSGMGQLMRIELMAPNLNQARVVERAWKSRSESVLKAVMAALTANPEG